CLSFVQLRTYCCNIFFFYWYAVYLDIHSFPTRRSSDLDSEDRSLCGIANTFGASVLMTGTRNCFFFPSLEFCSFDKRVGRYRRRSEEHTSELQSRSDLVCRLLLEKKKITRSPLIFTSPT